MSKVSSRASTKSALRGFARTAKSGVKGFAVTGKERASQLRKATGRNLKGINEVIKAAMFAKNNPELVAQVTGILAYLAKGYPEELQTYLLLLFSKVGDPYSTHATQDNPKIKPIWRTIESIQQEYTLPGAVNSPTKRPEKDSQRLPTGRWRLRD